MWVEESEKRQEAERLKEVASRYGYAMRGADVGIRGARD